MNNQTNKQIFNSNFAFSTKLYRSMCKILGPYVLAPAPDYEDKNRCTDLTLVGGDVKIACRIRHAKYIKYQDEMTIRFKTQTNTNKTEFEKLFNDKLPLNYYLYGFSNEEETDLISYKLIDWPKFRDTMISQFKLRTLVVDKDFGHKYNSDGSSFIWYNLNSFKECIVEEKKF